MTKITSSKSQEFWMDVNFQWQLPSPEIYHPKSSFTRTYAGLINVLQPYSHHWCTPQTDYTLMIPSGRKISDIPVTYKIDKPMRYQIPLLPKISYESYLKNFNYTQTQTYDWPAWIISMWLMALTVKIIYMSSFIYILSFPISLFACYCSLLLFLFSLIQTWPLHPSSL